MVFGVDSQGREVRLELGLIEGAEVACGESDEGSVEVGVECAD